jgi:hypothetical protein
MGFQVWVEPVEMLLAFDMWEARFRTTVSFNEVTAAEQVSLLGDALEGPALRFYYKEIVSDSARAGGGAHTGSAADPATNLSPNVTSLSQAVVEPPQNWRLYQPCLSVPAVLCRRNLCGRLDGLDDHLAAIVASHAV